MNELEQLCKEQNLSLFLHFNNHKRFKMSVREYADVFFGDGFKDPEGQAWLDAMERRNTIIEISIYDNSMKARFINYDCDLTNCIADTIMAIQANYRPDDNAEPIDWQLAPKD